MAAVAMKAPHPVVSSAVSYPNVFSGARLRTSRTDPSIATTALLADLVPSEASHLLTRRVSSPLSTLAKSRERPQATRERSLLTKRYRPSLTDHPQPSSQPSQSSPQLPPLTPYQLESFAVLSSSTAGVPHPRDRSRPPIRKQKESVSGSLDAFRFRHRPESSGHQRTASLGSPAARTRESRFSLADFRLGKVLGSGGTATVIRAELRLPKRRSPGPYCSPSRVGSDTHLVLPESEAIQSDCKSCEVALKVVEKKCLSRRALHYLAREITIHRAVQSHCNVVSLHDVFDDGSSIYLVQELLRGGDLYTALKRERSGIPEDTALGVVEQILEALVFMHKHGFAHRDIKPENIMFTERPALGNGRVGTVKLIDFGLACARDPKAPVRERTSAEKCGTVRYAAPEVVTDPSYIPELADVWSVGVVLYSAIAHRNPFTGKTEKEVLSHIEDGGPCFEGDEWDMVSDETKSIISGMLRRKPSERPSAIRALQLVRTTLVQLRRSSHASLSSSRHYICRRRTQSLGPGNELEKIRNEELVGTAPGRSANRRSGVSCDGVRHGPNLFDGLRALFSGGSNEYS